MILRSKVFLVAVWAVACLAQASERRALLRPAMLRAGPGVYYPVLERLDKGRVLSILEEGLRWTKVKTDAGTEGWVSRRGFTERPAPRGFAKVLTDRGLSGASSTVVTMGARGMLPSPVPDGGAGPLAGDFLMRSAFRPEGLGSFLADLDQRSCEQLTAGGISAGAVEGDPELDALERGLGLVLVSRMLAQAEPITDPAIDDYVNKVGMAVALHSSRYDLPWRFVVQRQGQAEASFAPGGLVLLSSGLLKGLADEAELAGVIGHQIAHIGLGHGAGQLARALDRNRMAPEEAAGAGRSAHPSEQAAMDRLAQEAWLVLRAPRQAKDELQADALGMILASCAGYDSLALGRVYQRLGAFEPSGADSPDAKRRVLKMNRLSRDSKLSGGKTLRGRFRQVLANRRF